MAHAPLLRTQTTPNFLRTSRSGVAAGLASGIPAPSPASIAASRASHRSFSSSLRNANSVINDNSNNTNINNNMAPSQANGSLTSSTNSLVGTPSVNGMPGGPQAATNIINQRADASRSLYQRCIALSARLAQVPGFEEYLQQLDPADPVESLWSLLKKGQPLLVIYNASKPTTALQPAPPSEPAQTRRKKAIYQFCTACVGELRMHDSFMLRDLDDNDTTGFVKVTHVVNRVLDIVQERGLLLPAPEPAEVTNRDGSAVSGAPAAKMTQRDYVVREIVDTERKYVQDLENLHDLKVALEHRGDLSGDHRHAIFMNINAILDFQRRFLIRIEATNSMPDAQQMWGSCFTTYEDGFNIYHQFIAGHQKAAETALREFDKIRLVDHPVATDQSTLDGFLLKPMQRLSKYPLFLKVSWVCC